MRGGGKAVGPSLLWSARRFFFFFGSCFVVLQLFFCFCFFKKQNIMCLPHVVVLKLNQQVESVYSFLCVYLSHFPASQVYSFTEVGGRPLQLMFQKPARCFCPLCELAFSAGRRVFFLLDLPSSPAPSKSRATSGRPGPAIPRRRGFAPRLGITGKQPGEFHRLLSGVGSSNRGPQDGVPLGSL